MTRPTANTTKPPCAKRVAHFRGGRCWQCNRREPCGKGKAVQQQERSINRPTLANVATPACDMMETGSPRIVTASDPPNTGRRRWAARPTQTRACEATAATGPRPTIPPRPSGVPRPIQTSGRRATGPCPAASPRRSTRRETRRSRHSPGAGRTGEIALANAIRTAVRDFEPRSAQFARSRGRSPDLAETADRRSPGVVMAHR